MKSLVVRETGPGDPEGAEEGPGRVQWTEVERVDTQGHEDP